MAFSSTLNFTRAAKLVGLSQPALFERVRKLGDALEVPLYTREGRALELTEQGVQVAAFARSVLEQAEGFTGNLKGERAQSVTLAAGEGAYLYLLGPALERFAKGPHALQLLTLGGPSAVAAVRSGEAHLAVGVFDIVPRGVHSQDILQTPLCAALARTHKLAKKRSISLADLAGQRLILAPEGRKQHDLVGRALALAGHPGASRSAFVEADGWALMLAFARAGLGVAVVNGICKPPAGAVLRPIPELGSVTYKLLSRRRGALSSAALELKETIMALQV